jgi:hypothetical protein
VLFSNDDVAGFINGNFEATWEMVRPVPRVSIDFGNGNVVTRTLHGNIATYVCSTDGQVLDLIGGIYTSSAYLNCLREFKLLARYADQNGKDRRDETLKAYHQFQLAWLEKNQDLQLKLMPNLLDVSKAVRIEPAAKLVLFPARYREDATAGRASDNRRLDRSDDLSTWKVLVDDTRANETVRRKQIHELLVQTGAVRPSNVTRRVYKEVLHADLDDPYLGLGESLFANYPFAKEDRAAKSAAAERTVNKP